MFFYINSKRLLVVFSVGNYREHNFAHLTDFLSLYPLQQILSIANLIRHFLKRFHAR